MRIRLFFVITILLSGNLFSLDGKRKGLLLGFGAGLANVSYNQEIEYEGEPSVYIEDSVVSETFNEITFATDWRIGYAPNNNIELFVNSKENYIQMENVYGDHVTINNGVILLSMSYFLNPALEKDIWVPSFFINGGLGASFWTAEESEPWIGSGLGVGTGYEWKKHWRVSLDYFINNPSTEENSIKFTTNSQSIMLTIQGMAY